MQLLIEYIWRQFLLETFSPLSWFGAYFSDWLVYTTYLPFLPCLHQIWFVCTTSFWTLFRLHPLFLYLHSTVVFCLALVSHHYCNGCSSSRSDCCFIVAKKRGGCCSDSKEILSVIWISSECLPGSVVTVIWITSLKYRSGFFFSLLLLFFYWCWPPRMNWLCRWTFIEIKTRTTHCSAINCTSRRELMLCSFIISAAAVTI